MTAPDTWADFFAPIAGLSEQDKTTLLRRFVRESNEIEGINRTPSRREIAAHVSLLSAPTLTIPLLCQFVSAVQPGAKLRTESFHNVVVGNHVPPPGGIAVAYKLQELLDAAEDPYEAHIAYETLHPFTDGNGRSGRALWLRMQGPSGLVNLFLTEFYYETLRRSRL